jgi:Flp pilus assembly protein TadD
VPASLVDLRDAAAWCPACFVDGRPSPAAEGLDTYLALAGRAYAASPAEMARVRRDAGQGRRVIAGSAYLGAIVPESADVHNILGIALAEKGQIGDAIGEFREAVRLEPRSAQSHWHLGAALAYSGDRVGAIEHLLQSVQIDPNNPQARHDLDVVLDRRRQRP